MLKRRGERSLINLLPDGRLKNSSTLHGRYYKASPATAGLLGQVARRAPAGTPELESLRPSGRVT
jgi:hypothetical protein